MISIKIKTPVKFLSMLILATGLVFTACKDNFVSPSSPTGTTLLSLIKADTGLNILTAALQKTNQAGSLDNNNSGLFTIFAPTDSAFVVYFQGKLGKPAFTEDSVLLYISNMTVTTAVTISTLSGILTYHEASSELTKAQLVGDGQSITTLNGARLSVSDVGGTVLLNANIASGAYTGAKIETFDTQASNGIIHKINRVLLPISTAAPTTSIISYLGMSVSYSTNPATVTVPSGSTNFNVLANALKKTGLALTILPNAAPLPDFTLFAPDDASFTSYLTSAYPASVSNEATAITFINGLGDSTTPTLAAFTDMIKYHIVAGRFLSTDFVSAQAINTLSDGHTITIDPATLKITDGKGDQIAITTKDQLTNAGLVQVIGGVLLAD